MIRAYFPWYHASVAFRRLFWLSLLALTLSACALQQPPPPAILAPWSYADLRLLDPADAGQPSHDLTAVYLRQSGDELQIRLDLLDGVEQLDYDLYLALQAGPGETTSLPIQAQADLAWDTLLVIPSDGKLQALMPDGQPQPDIALMVFRDPSADALYISLNRLALGPEPATFTPASALKLQVFLTPAGSPSPAGSVRPGDRTAILSTTGPPPAPANVLFAFWDSYPAYTPATALRRWDGAHTGPLGGRHGLHNLLRTAQAAQVPLVLLDLKDPASLSALDYAGGLGLVQQMAQAGLLILPDPLQDPRFGPFDLPIQAQEDLLQSTKETVAAFNLPASPFLYLPASVPPPQTGRSALFARLKLEDTLASAALAGPSASPLSLMRWQGRTVIPVPDGTAPDGPNSPNSPPVQAATDGITVDWRRRLLRTALYANQPGITAGNTFLWLGGDLPGSAWGDPQSARAAFQWLKTHPWVQFLDANALLSARPTQPLSASLDEQAQPALPGAPAELLAALQSAASPGAAMYGAAGNPLVKAAWQAYQALYAPVYPAPPQLSALRQQSTGQVWSLLAAAHWAAAPEKLASCQVDPDHDGQPECLLASGRFYTQFETDSASLTDLFAAYNAQSQPAGWTDAIHQLIGPFSQFITGLNSLEVWQPQAWSPAGLLAGPSANPGAFAGPGTGFLPEISGESLVFRSPDGKVVKTFRLTETGLQVQYQLAAGSSYPPAQVPLALDPWRRFTPGWADLYRAESSPNLWSWQIQAGPRLLVRASTSLTGGEFNQSRSLFSLAENPDQDFPLAHFTPFPLAVVQVSLSENTLISLQVIPQP